jgi:hypothetical protein
MEGRRRAAALTRFDPWDMVSNPIRVRKHAMSNVTDLRNPAFDAQTIGDFSDAARVVMQDHVWLLGDDLSTMVAVVEDLRVLAHIVTTGIRDDVAIRTEATRLIRIVEKRANRDYDGGLLDAEVVDFVVLYYPDRWATMRDEDAVYIDISAKDSALARAIELGRVPSDEIERIAEGFDFSGISSDFLTLGSIALGNAAWDARDALAA